MVRGKLEIKKIENLTSRQVTFSKRRKGLLKKAHELSVLCDAQIAAIVFSQNGGFYDFASSDMKKIMEQYEIYKREYFGVDRLQRQKYVQELKNQMTIMVNKIEHLQFHCRRLMGQDLDSCSVEELKETTIQIEKSLAIVRTRKAKLNEDAIDKLKAQIAGEREALNENRKLHQLRGPESWRELERAKKNGRLFEEKPLWMQSRSLESEKNADSCGCGDMNKSDVKTDLFIGLPES